jgi:hypothetical protein
MLCHIDIAWTQNVLYQSQTDALYGARNAGRYKSTVCVAGARTISVFDFGCIEPVFGIVVLQRLGLEAADQMCACFIPFQVWI